MVPGPAVTYFEDGKKRSPLKNQMRVLVGVTIVVGVGAYIWHRRVLDRSIVAMSMLMEDDRWQNFDDGVKYGLALAKDAAIDGFAAADAARHGYAFGAFDKAV